MPERIQRKRTRGWRMPEGAVYVGRPTVFGNPFRVVKSSCCRNWDVVDDNGVTYVIDHQWAHAHNWEDLHRPGARRFAINESVRLFAEELTYWFGGRMKYDQPFTEAVESLRGRDLACWCPVDQPCHADVLLELANEESR